MSLASLASSISSGINSAPTDFAAFQTKMQQTLDDRRANFTSKISSNSALQQTFNQIQAGFASGVSPSGLPIGVPPGMSLSGGLVDLQGSSYYSDLQTLVTYSVHAQAAAFTGLIASKVLLIPMTFSVVLPDQAFLSVPEIQPLALIVNPKTWSRSSTKKNTNTFTRGGYKSERWGEELEQIDASGDIGAYYTQQTGLTRFNR